MCACEVGSSNLDVPRTSDFNLVMVCIAFHSFGSMFEIGSSTLSSS